ncbi:MAG: aminotransferase class I/II-fold pyridoxal phosphate-dependent enzyme [Rhodopirellula sp.]|nr:aminotransferase class I/II-fold pyridoxal phosphate-dependent enzyme [Rhodopirellula sp.]
MSSNRPNHSIPRVSPRAYAYVQEVLNFGFHNAHSVGMTARLEREFAARMGQKHGIAHCNGTATLQSALLAAEVGVGDEVIVPAFTVFSTPAAALQCGAVPVVADVDSQTWTIDVADIRRKLSPRTKAIIPVSICGLMPDMDPIMEIAGEHGLVVIEDNAQGYLCEYQGRLSGSIGHFASFSFQASKTLTCGDGGILISSDDALALKARRAATIGFRDLSIRPGDTVVPEELRCRPDYKRHSSLGWNQRLPEVACAVALAELERIDELVAMRVACGEAFNEVVDRCDWLRPQRVPPGYRHTYWTYPVKIERDDVPWSEFRRRFVELGGDGFYGAYCPAHLEEVFGNLTEAIRTQPERYPHWAPYWPDYGEGLCPVWEAIQPKIAMLKTNYFDTNEIEQQADVFERTIRSFS